MRSFLLGTAVCASLAAATSTSYFTVSGVQEEAFNDSFDITFNVYDPDTNTTTSCYTNWLYPAEPVPHWNECNDKTFSFKIDSYYTSLNPPTSTDKFDVFEIKHQYRGTGKPCLASNGPACTTKRAYLSLQVSEAEFVQSGSDMAMISNNYGNWPGSYQATIFSSCGSGCGLTSGAN